MTYCGRVIQLSDTHLFAGGTSLLYGVNPLDRLQAVIRTVAQNHPDMAAIVVSGDLSQDESLASYEQLKSCLAPLQAPFYWLCGNHDNRQQMMAACRQAMVQRLVIHNWQLLLLNSQVPGAIPGKLTDEQLSWLRTCLEQSPGQPTLLALHHHPCSVGSHWLDQIGLDNAGALAALLGDYPQVRAVIHGHAHQAAENRLGAVPCYGVPSTCVQFLPESHDFALDCSQLPGYRVLDLYSDGRLKTRVIRVD